METDHIIVGQGICGTLLSWLLIKAGKKVIVIDEAKPYSAGMVASGLINPVTGMRVAKSWMIDELIPAADSLYKAIEEDLGVSITTPYTLLEFHTTLQSCELYKERMDQGAAYLEDYINDSNWDLFLNFHYGVSAINNCSVVDMRKLQSEWRKRLSATGDLREERFDHNHLMVTDDKVFYKEIEAKKIIFCEGTSGMQNPYFSLLPFALTKGEALILSIPGLPRTNILKHGLKIVPWDEGLFWLGSSFDWKYDDLQPSELFRMKAEAQLKQWLRLTYTVEHHWASERPGTVDRKPFAGFHPQYPAVGILNGMGAKGCSQAPYFSGVMAAHLTEGAPLNAEADILRYKRILGRGVN